MTIETSKVSGDFKINIGKQKYYASIYDRATGRSHWLYASCNSKKEAADIFAQYISKNTIVFTRINHPYCVIKKVAVSLGRSRQILHRFYRGYIFNITSKEMTRLVKKSKYYKIDSKKRKEKLKKFRKKKAKKEVSLTKSRAKNLTSRIYMDIAELKKCNKKLKRSKNILKEK